jgi:hypothetical protein
MLAALLQRYRDERLQRTMWAVVTNDQGCAARSWPLPATPDDLPALTITIRDWLALQLTEMTTPYGFSRYRIGRGLARMDGNDRTPLWSHLLPTFTRQAAQDGLDAAHQQLLMLPRADHPTATYIEVHLLSLGDILKAAYTRLDYE